MSLKLWCTLQMSVRDHLSDGLAPAGANYLPGPGRDDFWPHEVTLGSLVAKLAWRRQGRAAPRAVLRWPSLKLCCMHCATAYNASSVESWRGNKFKLLVSRNEPFHVTCLSTSPDHEFIVHMQMLFTSIMLERNVSRQMSALLKNQSVVREFVNIWQTSSVCWMSSCCCCATGVVVIRANACVRLQRCHHTAAAIALAPRLTALV
eukprot:5198737-Pleurochrysis_carterae.AAC.4